MTLFKY